MKNVLFSVSLLISFVAGLGTSSVRAQTFSIDWSAIAGGAATGTGGIFSISGTLGQAIAGPAMNGGSFSLTGGFWSLFAVPTPGSPLISIRLTTTNTVVVSWPSPSTGFRLQQSTGLDSANWTLPSETITDNGTTKFIIVNPPAGNRFYRLVKP